MSIPADKLAAIRERADIVAVIGRYVSLKKRGQRYIGLCPFHNEKTPSFSVSAQKGLYYCFGCHAGGDVLSFLMRHEGLDFQGAAEKLAAEAGVEIAQESPAEKKRRQHEEELVRVNDYALAFFEHALWDDAGQVARDYLAQRAVKSTQAKSARLGYGGRPGELVQYLTAKKVHLELAAQAGMLTEDGQRGLFDQRLVFPIHDGRGRCVGFGGRAMSGDATAKYVNTRESPIFAKRRLLFGWPTALTAIVRDRRVVLVEGYMDVLACQAAGVANAVAALGTALTPEHAETIRRTAQEAVLLLDGDAAGQRGSMEAAVHLLAAGIRTFVAPLPAGEDPDSLARTQGGPALKTALAQAVPILEHAIRAAFAQPDMTIEARVSAAERLAPLFGALGTGLEKDLYLSRLAERVGVPADRLLAHLSKASKKGVAKAKPQPASPAPTAKPPPTAKAEVDEVELRMVQELLFFPDLRPELGKVAELASHPVTRNLLSALTRVERSVAEVVAETVPDAGWQRQLTNAKPLNPDGESVPERARKTLDDSLRQLQIRHLDKILQELLLELKEVEAHGGETDEIVRRKQELTRRRNALKNRLPA